MSQIKTVLIAGGGYAGIIAANRLVRKNLPINVVLITVHEKFQERIRNHQLLAGTLKNTYTVRSLLHKKVKLIIGRIEKIEKQNKQLLLEDKSILSYDHLIYSLGVQGNIRSKNPETYVQIADVNDSARMHDILLKNKSAKITVLGAGLSGIETASELANEFPETKITIIDSNRLGNGFSQKAQNKIKDFLSKNNVKILENYEVIKYTNDGLISTQGQKIKHDVCVLANGLSASEIGFLSGLRTNRKGQVHVNQFLEVEGNPEIIGAGDCVQVVSSGYDHLRMACATAIPMGIYAAERLVFQLGFSSKKGSRPFSLAYLGKNVSLGRRDGIIQESEPNDSPKEKIWTNRNAVWIKELICKFTILSFRLEKWFDFYFWKSFPESGEKLKAEHWVTQSEK
ncbi:NAD(P)/FAD-dependent oxidoreductase [Leptospira sp. WS92.C1]